jgi:hypothetical protein
VAFVNLLSMRAPQMFAVLILITLKASQACSPVVQCLPAMSSPVHAVNHGLRYSSRTIWKHHFFARIPNHQIHPTDCLPMATE